MHDIIVLTISYTTFQRTVKEVTHIWSGECQYIGYKVILILIKSNISTTTKNNCKSKQKK